MGKTVQVILFIFIFITGTGQVPPGLPSILDESQPEGRISSKHWENVRRPEILESFKRQIYGSIPVNFNPEVNSELIESGRKALRGLAVLQQVHIII